jgi:hypothetical protein
MTRPPLIVLLVLLAAGCIAQRPVLAVAQKVKAKPSTWMVPLDTPNTDRICVQTVEHFYRVCWTIGELRIAMVSLKAD